MPIVLPAAPGGGPEGIERDKKRAAPLPCIVVFQRAERRIGYRVARVERIRPRIWKIAPALLERPRRHAAGGAVVAGATFAIVIAKHEEQWRGMAEQSEVIALGDVLGKSLMEVGPAFVDHE